MNDQIVSALIGLTGACENNGKTEKTDEIVMDALLNCYEKSDTSTIVSAIRRDKFTISPNCQTCPTPCGNTSDYDMQKFYANEKLKLIKEELLKEVITLVARIKAADKSDLPDAVYQALTYFRYELDEEAYKKLITSVKQMEV